MNTTIRPILNGLAASNGSGPMGSRGSTGRISTTSTANWSVALTSASSMLLTKRSVNGLEASSTVVATATAAAIVS